MGWNVSTTAAGGLPVVDVTATTKLGIPVSEVPAAFGHAVTKVATGFGVPVVYVAPPLLFRSTAVVKDDVGPLPRHDEGADPDELDEQIAEAIDEGDATIVRHH
jgi:hypothetical protein